LSEGELFKIHRYKISFFEKRVLNQYLIRPNPLVVKDEENLRIGSDKPRVLLLLEKMRMESFISPIWHFGDLSDGITMVQLLKIMTDLFRISYSYQHRAARVKSKLDQPGKPWPEILPVNLTFSKN